MAQIEMVCGHYRIVSLMSAEAADELGLGAGRPRHRVGEVDQRGRRTPAPEEKLMKRPTVRPVVALLAAAALVAPLSGCGADVRLREVGRQAGTTTLQVLAAASLTDVFERPGE